MSATEAAVGIMLSHSGDLLFLDSQEGGAKAKTMVGITPPRLEHHLGSPNRVAIGGTALP